MVEGKQTTVFPFSIELNHIFVKKKPFKLSNIAIQIKKLTISYPHCVYLHHEINKKSTVS